MRKIIVILIIILSTFSLVGCEFQPKSAYDIAVENGFNGTVEEWLKSLNVVGKSAYDIAVENGFNGTVEEWLKSLNVVGKSAYELAVEIGFDGTMEEWLLSLEGLDAANITINDLYDVAVENGYVGSILNFIEEYMDNDNTQLSIKNNTVLSVVSINCTFQKTVIKSGRLVTEEYASAGAGVIYDLNKEDGSTYIITNYHVVYDYLANTENHISNNIDIYLFGMEYSDYAIDASYIGGSMTNDIAVLKVSNSDLLKNSNAKKVIIGDSNEIIVGQDVYAVGNPGGDGIAITDGIVNVDSENINMTAPDKVTPMNLRVIRTDTAINGGNSGGGLFDANGCLIGIVNAKNIESNVDNVGYAIPMSLVKNLVGSIIDNYNINQTLKINKCILGITTKISSSKSVFDAATNSVKIEQVISVDSISSGSVCDGKLQANDIINSVSINQKQYQIDRNFILSELLFSCRKDEIITLNITRSTSNLDIDITLSNIIVIE